MADMKTIKQLALKVIKHEPYADYTSDNVEAALFGELNELAKDWKSWRRNALDIYELVEETFDEVLPNRVTMSMAPFAEIMNVNDGQRAVFKVRKGKQRAKKFVTYAAVSGVYEAFRLDTETFEIPTKALGGATYIDFDRYVQGVESLEEQMNILLEGFEDRIYGEVQKALKAVVNNPAMPAANFITDSSFDADKMAKLCAIARAYGNGATIFAPYEFIAAMGPDAIGGTKSPAYSVNDIEDIRTKGYIGIFRGTPVNAIPQSFIDETNTATAIDPQLAYIFPTGGEKVVKLVFEGGTHAKEWDNRDNSKEVQIYRKVGVGILTYHNWCVYQNTGITQTYEPEA